MMCLRRCPRPVKRWSRVLIWYMQVPYGIRCCQREFVHGDVAAGFQAAEVVVEQTYVTPRQEQAFLETESGVAYQDDSGVLHVFSCLQDPYGVAEDIHLALAIPKSRIHVKGTLVGGGFGGKLNTTIQVHLAAMTCLAGVPVMSYSIGRSGLPSTPNGTRWRPN